MSLNLIPEIHVDVCLPAVWQSVECLVCAQSTQLKPPPLLLATTEMILGSTPLVHSSMWPHHYRSSQGSLSLILPIIFHSTLHFVSSPGHLSFFFLSSDWAGVATWYSNWETGWTTGQIDSTGRCLSQLQNVQTSFGACSLQFRGYGGHRRQSKCRSLEARSHTTFTDTSLIKHTVTLSSIPFHSLIFQPTSTLPS